MKKFLSIFMCAILIVALFVVPLTASASNETITLKAGTYRFNDVLTGLPNEGEDTIIIRIPFTVYEESTQTEKSYTNITLEWVSSTNMSAGVTQIGKAMTYRLDSGGGIQVYFDGTMEYNGETYTAAQFTSENVQTITITEDTEVSEAHGELFIANTNYNEVNVLSYCDGSTCPATDTNEDNICDDCGLPFTFALRNDTYNFNGVYMPTTVELQDGSTSTVKDVWSIVKQTGGNIILMSDGEFENSTLRTVSSDVVYDNGQVVITGLTIVTNYEATYTDDGTPYWKFAATETWNTDGASVGNENQILWVADDVKDRQGILVKLNGDVNFRTPLWEEMGQVTQGEMPNLTTTLGGNLMTLTLCGVGLLTLLVALALLLKTLRTYLPK